MPFLQFVKKYLYHTNLQEYSITTRAAFFLVLIVLGKRLLESEVPAWFSVLQSFNVISLWYFIHSILAQTPCWIIFVGIQLLVTIKEYPSKNFHWEKKTGNLSSIRLKIRCGHHVVTQCYLQVHFSSVKWLLVDLNCSLSEMKISVSLQKIS